MSALAEAFVRLRVDSSLVAADTSKGIKEGAAAADAESEGASAGSKFSSAFNKALKVGMIAAIAVAAIGAASIKAGIDFQNSMTRIQTQAGASASQVKQLTGEVLKLAPSTEQGPQALADSLYHLKSVGLDNKDAMSALAAASNLAAVGGSNLEQTTNALGAAWRSGIDGAQNFTQATATLNAIVGAGNMQMSQLVGAMSTGVLSAARTFGVSLKQVGGALALMTDSGVPAQQAANELRMTLSLIGAPSKTAAKQLASIGLSSTDLANAMRGPQGIVGAISMLKQHLDASGLSATDSAALLSRAFGGGKSSSAILTMINNLQALKGKQEQINASMGKFGADVAAQRKTASAQFDLLRSSVETVGVRIGLALLPPVTRFVKYLASTLLPDIIKFGGVIGNALKNPYMQAFLAGLGTALITIKLIVTAMKIWEGIQLIIEATSPLGLAIVAVAALAAGITVLWERSATFRTIVEGAFKAVKDAAMDAYHWVLGHWKLLAGILLAVFAPELLLVGLAFMLLLKPVEKAFDAIKEIITGGFDKWWASHGAALEKVWSEVWGVIKAVFGAVWGVVVNDVKTGWNIFMGILRPGLSLIANLWRITWGLVSAVFRGAWDVITAVAKAAWAILSGIFEIGFALVKAIVKTAWDVIAGIFSIAIDLLTGHWHQAWTDLWNMLKQVFNNIVSFLGTAWGTITRTAAAAFNALLGGAKSLVLDLFGWFKKVPGEILSALGDVGKMLWNAGVSIIKGLIGGLKAGIGGIGHVMGSVANVIKGFLPFSPAKMGPLSGKGDPFYSGLSIGKKIASGITASIPGLKKAVTESTSAINAALKKATAEQKSGTAELSSLTGKKDSLEKLRDTEEKMIKALEAKRASEEKDKPAGYKELRKAQEDDIKSLEKLRGKQEDQVKQVDKVTETLKKSMTKLKDEVDKLKESLKKAAEAAAKAAKKLAEAAAKAAKAADDTSSDSGDSSGDSSGSGDSAPDWGAFNAWMSETGPVNVNSAGGGSGQGYPGPFGGSGSGFAPGMGPGLLGQAGGRAFGGDGSSMMTGMLIDRFDQLIAITQGAPGRNAAATASAMNGVAGTAIIRGGW